MTQRGVTQHGVPNASTLSEGWVLVLGGVTRVGNRRARREIRRAGEEGRDVVWFDGFCETVAETGERLAVELKAGRLWIVDLRSAEETTLAGRLRLGTALRSNALSRFLWKVIGRRLGLLLRPRACWKVIREDILSLRSSPPPQAIILGDDIAVTSAWYAGRLWPGSPITTDLPGSAS